MVTEHFNVSGIKCGGCENTVQLAALAVAGVSACKASAKDGSVEVEFDETKTSLDTIKQAVQAKGYPLV